MIKFMATGIENLKIYNLSARLELVLSKVVKGFPSEEKYRSVDQILRSSASVCNNIAESYQRLGRKEKIYYLSIAKGEAEETRQNMIRAYQKGYISHNNAKILNVKYIELLKGISGYIKFIRNNNQ